MSLPFELTTLPPQALDVLRYMGRTQRDQADTDDIMNGSGLTERSFSKAIKRLVTKNYMTMDAARVYHLTPKGYKAIEDVLAHDEVEPPSNTPTNENIIRYDLCVIVPDAVKSNETNTLMLGLEPEEGEGIPQHADVILRLEVVGGNVEPNEFVAPVSPDLPVLMAEFQVTPTATLGDIRVRVEAFQTIRMDDIEEIGGMYFDVALDQALIRPRALHCTLDIVD